MSLLFHLLQEADPTNSTPILQDAIRFQWLYVLDGFLKLDRCSEILTYENQIRAWRDMGEAIGLSEELVSKEASIRRAAGKPTIGCCWHRCPLYETSEVPVGREEMSCSRCKKVRVSLFGSPALRADDILTRRSIAPFIARECESRLA